MTRRRAFLLFLTAGGFTAWAFFPIAPRESRPAALAQSPAGPMDRKEPGHRTIGADWLDLLARCESGLEPAALERRLAETKARWLEEEPHVTAQVIGQLLRGGTDATTGIPFETGPGGTLRGWPTLRVFLLDVLAVTDPDLAVEIAREVLATTGSAEEFAVALKPLTLRGPWRASDEELAGHFARMLETPAWQQSVGLAEALDLSRAVASPAVVETLARWLDQSPPALSAGGMALHETAAGRPDLVTDLISSGGDLLSGQPELRASLMARARVADADQAGQVENYLKDPEVSVAEKQEFLKLFPLRSATTGYRLYGKPPSPFRAADVRDEDRAALEIVTAWRADPELAGVAEGLAALEQRLQSWQRQAGD